MHYSFPKMKLINKTISNMFWLPSWFKSPEIFSLFPSRIKLARVTKSNMFIIPSSFMSPNGKDEDRALKTLETLITDKFDEE